MSVLADKFITVLEHSGSKHFLESILTQIASNVQLINFLHRYSVFNGDFAGGVASLAGAFHVRRDLFRDSAEKLIHCADRSSEIASYIFFAAEDEYADRYTSRRVTHRQLGQILLKETALYFNVDLDTFDQTFVMNPEIDVVLEKVIEGYRVNTKNSEEDIFRALGFHIGSELLADQEFRLIDRFLTIRYQGLVEHLTNTQTPYGTDAYRWISLHTKVEVEHFDHAITAAQKAKDYYCGKAHTKQEVEDMILEGFVNFGQLQRRFFYNVLQD
jgi:hypothetical protein